MQDPSLDGPPDTPAHPLVGQTLDGRYHIVELVGRGRMSVVFRAEDRYQSDRIVAVKVLESSLADETRREMFRRETRSLEQLAHPNVVAFHGRSDPERSDRYYIVLEYIPRTLADTIADHADETDNTWCWALMRQIVDGVVEAHGHNIIHRDLKPENVLIGPDGAAKLTDFGISLLTTELLGNQTVGIHWTPLYAAPEQREGKRATARSDIYALGRLFYHMLSRQIPPSRALTDAQIDALAVSAQMRAVLHEMLMLDPDERYPSARQLRRALTFTERYDRVPRIAIVATDDARRALINDGLITRNTADRVRAFLARELGADNPIEVHLRRAPDGTTVVLTESAVIRCLPHKDEPALTISTIDTLYEATMEKQRREAIPLRIEWDILVDGDDPLPPLDESDELVANLAWLDDQLVAHRHTRQEGGRRRHAQKHWDAVLKYQLSELESSRTLGYRHVKSSGSGFVFTLDANAPEDLSWQDGAPIAYIDESSQRAIRVGYFDRIRGNMLYVNADLAVTPSESGDTGVPARGRIGLDRIETRAILGRQQAAVDALRNGSTANPQLSEVLLDIESARFDPPDPNLTFFQDGLDPIKQDAVRRALSAQDVFLLQGPPGTGKTTTLAEITLQILKIQPDARILISSQSNIAVDQVLGRVARAHPGPLPEIVRVGREQKVGPESAEWRLTARIDGWRREVRARCREVEREISARIRKGKQAMERATPMDAVLRNDYTTCAELLDEAGAEVDALARDEYEHEALTARLVDNPGDDALRAELSALTGRIVHRREQLDEAIALVRGYVSADEEDDVASDVCDERERLQAALEHLVHPERIVQREQERLELLDRWQRDFGASDDFKKPIIARATIIAATCLMAGNRDLSNERYHWALIDEAGRATTPEVLVAMVRARRSILVGDQRQLPPLVDRELSRSILEELRTSRKQLEESLFEALVTQGDGDQEDSDGSVAVAMLTEQRRMHPAIGDLVSHVFYEDELHNDPSTRELDHGLDWLPAPVVWLSTSAMSGRREQEIDTGVCNPLEVSIIVGLLARMDDSYCAAGWGGDKRKRMAIITGYRLQVNKLMDRIAPESPRWRAVEIHITTVDDFQGQERPIVIYSSVRSNNRRYPGFLRDRRRLNVALSRAQEALIIVGDLDMLTGADCGDDGNPYQEIGVYMRTHPDDCAIRRADSPEVRNA